jgi:hypothetical protein
MKKIIFFLAAVIMVCSSFQKKKIKRVATVSISACMQKKIAAYKKLEKHEQPRRVVEYVYNGKKVYYVVAPCCDQFNELYDANCNKMGNPDGGFTGRGDGKFPDFAEKRTKERIVWKNE